MEEAGEPAVVEGVKGTWRVDPSLLGQPFSGRAALLSPFDRLLHDRKRTVELFGFDYQLEMYKPAAKRRWGYFALPILYGDQLIGKLDATADRGAGVLRVDAIHQDVPFDQDHDRRGGWRDQGPGPLARTGPQHHRLALSIRAGPVRVAGERTPLHGRDRGCARSWCSPA